MSSNFEFDAPQFVNFSDMDDLKADKFFDVNEQQDQIKMNRTLSSSTKSKGTPIHGQSDIENQVPSSTVKTRDPPSSKKNFTVLRKVLHEIVNHQIQNDTNTTGKEPKDQEKDIVQQFGKLHLSDSKSKKSRGPLKAYEVFSGVQATRSEKKLHPMVTRLDSVNRKSSSKQSLGSLQSENASECDVTSTTFNYGKSTSVKRNASPLNSARKFISLAEQVEHFFKDTPDRFRSKPAPARKSVIARPNLIPKTPNLTTKYRQRKINFPNEKEREEMELEEIKKHQIKAHPLNEKILMGPCLNLKVPIAKKPTTVPQPFSLTEVKKKEPPVEPVFQFKAQPVPATILNGPVGIPPRKPAPTTIPSTPQIKVPMRLRVEVKTEDKNTSGDGLVLPRNTVIEPFSFDARMKDLMLKKEEFIKKAIENEKKSFNSFKAHPMPDFKGRNNDVSPSRGCRKTVPQPFNLTQPKANKSFAEEQNAKVTPFKARPASVLHQKPFALKLQKHDTPLPSEFQLYTEKRAAERQKFEEKMKQKEEERAALLRLQKEEEEKVEKQKMMEERKKTEFKAAPMPHYKVFEIHLSDQDKITVPQSPMFARKTKKANV